MILVAGGIFIHNVPQVHDLLHGLPTTLAEFTSGLSVGIISVIFAFLIKRSSRIVKKRQN